MGLLEAYHFLNYDIMDPRSADVLYVSSPLPCMVLVAFYVYGSQVLGPNFMRDRPAFQLDGIIKIYNIGQILANLYIFWKAVKLVSDEKFDWRCMPILFDDSDYSLEILNTNYWFFWIKVIDLTDTVFFILRKKNNQVTFLHVYHHAILVVGLWFSIKYIPGGHPIFLGFINSFVHAVMYSYYLLTSIDSEYKKSIWWKKHITQLQMVQFLVIALHSSQILFRNPCGYPVLFAFMLVSQNVLMFMLFYDFYKKSYGAKKKSV